MPRKLPASNRQQMMLRQWLPWLLAAAALLALLPVIGLCAFNHPSPLDDYDNVRWQSFSARQWELYRHWSGRYLTNATLSLNPLHWHSLAGYRWAVAGMMPLYLGLFGAVVGFGLRRLAGLKAGAAFCVAVLCTALLVNNMPSLSEGFFWYSGAATYALPGAAFFGLLLFLFRLHFHQRSAVWLPAGLCLVLAAGGNEIMALCCDLVVGLCWWHAQQHKTELRKALFGLLLLCILSTAVALLAPGNFTRQGMNPAPSLSVGFVWLSVALHSWLGWLTNPYFLGLSTVLGWLFYHTDLRPIRLSLLRAFLLLPCIVLVTLLPAVAGLGEAPPPRVMNVVFANFLLGWILFLLVFVTYLKGISLPATGRAQVRQAALVLLVLVLAFSCLRGLREGQLFASLKSYQHRLPQQFDAQWHQRYARLAATQKDTLYFEPIRGQEQNPLFFLDISTWPSQGNQSLAEYWGRKMVYADTLQR